MFEELLKTESSWELLKNTSLPVAVYGTGNGADRVFDEFDKLGIKASAVVASDGFVRKRTFHGFEVKSVSQAEAEFGDFVIALCFASPLPQVIETLQAEGYKFVKATELLLPEPTEINHQGMQMAKKREEGSTAE